MEREAHNDAFTVVCRILNRIDQQQDKATTQEEQRKLEDQYGGDAIHRTFGRLDAYCEIRQIVAHERDKLEHGG